MLLSLQPPLNEDIRWAPAHLPAGFAQDLPLASLQQQDTFVIMHVRTLSGSFCLSGGLFGQRLSFDIASISTANMARDKAKISRTRLEDLES